MRRIIVRATTALLGAALAAASLAVGASGPAGADLLGVDVVIRLEDDSPLDPAAVVAAVGGVVRTDYDGAVDGFVARVPSVAVEALNVVPGVMEVTRGRAVDTTPESEPSAIGGPGLGFVPGGFTNRESGSSFTALDTANLARVIRADRVRSSTTGRGIDIAMIDTGVAPVAGAGPVIRPIDLSFDRGGPAGSNDGFGHGTHLAGIVNGTGAVPGIAPGSRVVDIKAGAADGAVDVSQVIAAIDWVVTNRDANGMDIRVLLLAYGTDGVQPYEIDPLAHAVENAWRHGVVVVVAAGNSGQGTSSLVNPATDPYVIAVGASETNGTITTADDTLATFTNRGSATRGVDVLAPGRSIVSLRVPGSAIDLAHPEGRVDATRFRGSGTSQAAAVVAATAALVLEDRPWLTPDQVKWVLSETARPLPGVDASLQGAGVIDASRAVLRPVARPNVGRQTFATSTGSGTLEGARGSMHVVSPDGEVLTGEQTVFGPDWNGQSWSGQSWSGQSWSGQSWSGQSWSGGSWAGQSWSGQSWSGQSWSGQSWSGQSWSGQSWSGQSWSGQSWSGQSWSGQSWSGAGT